MSDEEGVPDSIEWIPSGLPPNYDPSPRPVDMLRWEEDILPMIEETRNARDAAIIATTWNLGARPFEFQDIKVGDIADSTHGLQVTVQGKRGQRSPTLILAIPYQRWFDDHPAPDDRTAPLWSKLTKPEPISNRMYRKMLQQVADRAGVIRPVTLSNFRKSCASYLAAQNVNQVNIENHMGWTRGSRICSRYIAVFSGENEREIAKAYGADVKESELDPIAHRTCYRCRRETPWDKDRCMWCGQVLEAKAIERVRDDESAVRTALLKLVRMYPDVVDEVVESERMMETLENRLELEEEIIELAEILADD